MLNVVLINPEIPFNTGNIGRTCVATGSFLHLVGKLGFKINDREIRRSGLDYWPQLQWRHYPFFEDFLKAQPEGAELFFMSTKGRQSLWQARFRDGAYLVFGSESSGLPPELYERYARQLYRIPLVGNIRSLNLSSSAAVVIYEALRQTRHDPALTSL